MKKILLLALSVFALNHLFAQDVTVSPNPADLAEEMDLSDIYAESISHALIKNNGTETVGLRWEQKTLSSPSIEWTSAVCDNNKCYSFGGQSNNEIDGSPSDTLWIEADSTSLLDVHLRPTGIEGTGTIRVQVFNIDDIQGNNPLETAIFNFDITAATVSITEVEKNSIQVFPNPAQDYFQLANASSLEEITIYNIVGKPVKQFQVIDNKEYSVADLPMGMYLLQMRDKENDIVKTVRLVKKNP